MSKKLMALLLAVMLLLAAGCGLSLIHISPSTAFFTDTRD